MDFHENSTFFLLHSMNLCTQSVSHNLANPTLYNKQKHPKQTTSRLGTKKQIEKLKKTQLRHFLYTCLTTPRGISHFIEVSCSSLTVIYISKATSSIVSMYQVRYRCVTQERLREKGKNRRFINYLGASDGQETKPDAFPKSNLYQWVSLQNGCPA